MSLIIFVYLEILDAEQPDADNYHWFSRIGCKSYRNRVQDISSTSYSPNTKSLLTWYNSKTSCYGEGIYVVTKRKRKKNERKKKKENKVQIWNIYNKWWYQDSIFCMWLYFLVTERLTIVRCKLRRLLTSDSTTCCKVIRLSRSTT